MIKNILLPTDGSALSRRAVKDGVQLAKRLGARVTGFYVAPAFHIEVYDDMVYIPPDLLNPKAHAASALKTAQRHLKFVTRTAVENKVPRACYYVLSDSPADAIVKAARKYQCDLIYMGSHGRTGLTKLLLGSQTSKVLALTRVPVLVHR
jgi:nucleotide-binding universal stress UspA family protein